jgi:zinc protease
MSLHTRARVVLLVATVVTALGLASAQQPAPPPIPAAVLAAKLEDNVPVDPLITIGTLPNGFRYYIRENHLPQARAELRLAVNAGAVLEDDDQRGLAHFVEHMAFNGTTHFPANAIPTFMQSLGVRSARTSTRTPASTKRSTSCRFPPTTRR